MVFLAIVSNGHPKQVQYYPNLVDHCRAHLGDYPKKTLNATDSIKWVMKTAKTAISGLKMVIWALDATNFTNMQMLGYCCRAYPIQGDVL